jgi:hypothetical protein
MKSRWNSYKIFIGTKEGSSLSLAIRATVPLRVIEFRLSYLRRHLAPKDALALSMNQKEQWSLAVVIDFPDGGLETRNSLPWITRQLAKKRTNGARPPNLRHRPFLKGSCNQKLLQIPITALAI